MPLDDKPASGFTPPRGRDRKLALQLAYAEARAGCTRYIGVILNARCPRCHGTGDERGITYACQACAGRGKLGTDSCKACEGTGRFAESPCDSCEQGLVPQPETIQVTVPPGVHTGDHVLCPGKGDASRDGVPGDLHVTITVDTIGVLVQRGDDVVLELAVSARQLLFGGSIQVATLDGVVKLALPRGIRDGHTITLAGRGHIRPGASDHVSGDPYRDVARGDQLVVFRVPPDVLRARVNVVLGAAVTIGAAVIAAAVGL